VDTDHEVRIPHDFVPHVAERLAFYRRISEAKTEQELQQLARELADRFGLLPLPVLALLDTIRLRQVAIRLGFERLLHKSGTVRCTFRHAPNSPYFAGVPFGRLLDWIKLANAQPRAAEPVATAAPQPSQPKAAKTRVVSSEMFERMRAAKPITATTRNTPAESAPSRHNAQLKQVNDKLVLQLENVPAVKDVLLLLREIERHVLPSEATVPELPAVPELVVGQF
jgi:transcription-repair coupling factor (superfamily II helicase)